MIFQILLYPCAGGCIWEILNQSGDLMVRSSSDSAESAKAQAETAVRILELAGADHPGIAWLDKWALLKLKRRVWKK